MEIRADGLILVEIDCTRKGKPYTRRCWVRPDYWARKLAKAERARLRRARAAAQLELQLQLAP